MNRNQWHGFNRNEWHYLIRNSQMHPKDNFTPATFKGPRIIHIVFATIFSLGLFSGIMRVVYGKVQFTDDRTLIIASGVAVLFFFYKILFPRVMLSFSKNGIWIRDNEIVDYEEIDRLKFETRKGWKGVKHVCFVIYKRDLTEISISFNDLKPQPKTVAYFVKNNIEL